MEEEVNTAVAGGWLTPCTTAVEVVLTGRTSQHNAGCLGQARSAFSWVPCWCAWCPGLCV
jgi:hypothetical protein